MHELFGEDGATILSSSSTRISEPHRLTSYSVHLPDGFATLTIHSPSQIHGLIYKNNILYQIDHISRHRESLNEYEGRRLNGVEMVAFKRGERFVKREEANCREPEDGREEDHEHHEHGHGHEDLQLGHSPDEELFKLLSQTPLNHRHLSNDAGDPSRWTDCFPNDSIPKKLSMGISTDYLMYTSSGSNTEAVQSKVAEIVADTNTIYAYQLNIYLQVDELYIKTSVGGESWNNPSVETAGSCGMGIDDKLNALRAWAKSGGDRPSDRGLWHLLTPCYASGTVGLAYVGALCSGSSGYNTGVSGYSYSGCCSDWTTFAHEVGHNFGGGHSFEDGQGSTGGIMDYGDGLLDNIYQFNTKHRKTEMCNHISSRIGCEHFSSYAPECGNGVVEQGEECECPGGSTNCGCCVNCALPAGAECSDGECCDTGTCKFHKVTQGCESDTKHCINGACQATSCGTYGLQYCGPWTNNDCKVQCIYSGNCITLDGYSPAGLNFAPDNAQCLTQSGASGTCSSGECIQSSSGVTYDWVVGSWGGCSVTCGDGTQSRSVVCRDSNGNAASAASLCTNSKPATSQACSQPACATYSWKSESKVSYSSCTTDCDGGTQNRIGEACESSTGSMVSDSLCTTYATNLEPRATRPCGTAACPTSWDSGNWGACSRACGTGSQTRTVSCMKTQDSATSAVNDSECDLSFKPAASKNCNTQECSTFEWLSGNYGSCDTEKQDPFTGASCGSGTQDRLVTCIQTNDNDKVVADSNCDSSSKPGTSQSCTLSDCPSSEGGDYKGWVYSTYGACSVTCGEGIQYRELYCLKGYLDESDQSRKQLNDGELAGIDTSRILTADECTMAKPRLSQECTYDPCPEYDFVASAWSACSEDCGEGTKTRTVTCFNIATATPTSVADSYCLGVNLVKPDTSQSCYVQSCSTTCGPDSIPCSGYWAVTQWSSCDKNCGYGTKTRTVSCLKTSNDQSTNDRNCFGNRPSEVADCNAFDCAKYEVGEWGECDVTCGDGVEKRSVDCKDHLGRIVEGECDFLVRPSEEKPCYDQPCAHWHRGMWSDCGKTCGGGIQERSVECRLPHDDEYKGILVDPDDVALLCPADKPTMIQECNIDSCSGYYWNVTSWSTCSKDCNTGSQSRAVTCHSSPLNVANKAECEQRAGAEPPTTQSCNTFACPSYEWAIIGEFGECDADCGGGAGRRLVQCHDVTGDSVFGYDIPYKIVNDRYCGGKKPAETESCNSDKRNECGGNGVCRSNDCFCKPGYFGDQCDLKPKIENVTIIADSTLLTSGVPQGNVLEIRWESVGDIETVDMFLVPGTIGSEFEGKPVSKLPIPITSVNRYPNDKVFLFEVPARPHGSAVFDDYNVRVWHANGLSNLSPSFEISDQCAYKSCGAHGTCAGGDSKCVCSEGYTGEDCSIAPCVKIGCSDAEPGVATCFVNSTQNYEVSCECEEGWTGDSCQHRVECLNTCKNGGVATQVIVAPGQAAQCYPQDTTLNWCDCPRDSEYEGKTCETCGLSCSNSGNPDDECKQCSCKDNYFGNKCDCVYEEYKMKMKWVKNGGEDDVVGDVILGLPKMKHDKLKADGQRKADIEALEELIRHDVMKTILDSDGGVPSFGGKVDDVRIDVDGGGVFWVTFKLKGLCYDEPIGRRRVTEEAEEELKLAKEVLVAAGDDEYSTLRSQGRVTSSFIHFTDPTFHWWQFLVIVFGAVAGALLLGAGVAFVMYKTKGDGGWCVKKAGRGAVRGSNFNSYNSNNRKASNKPPPKLPKRKSKAKTELTKMDFV
ncbi:hypothetical protein TrLO_g4395 [Triparma laevis f. longispina]|uniref:Uncharacterized protein n=1 Tax=Triparma laevis f. longispina TaxID=1714387 RepID=A0A9W6ZDJ5_9STRA|nr:hypothetical protein TrLO_g4395 [Triparma laevis f. longispina]